MAHIRIPGLECNAEGCARLRRIAGQHGNRQQNIIARISQRQQTGRNERPVHTGHNNERHRACEQQHGKPRGKAVNRVDDELQYIADHQAKRREQTQRDRCSDDNDQQGL